MEEVLHHMPVQVPLWRDAAAGRADWGAIYDGYASAVDWPTAGFFRELFGAFASAKFILTVRDTDRWVESFSQTIYTLLGGRDQVPVEMRDWFDMCSSVISRSGFPQDLDGAGLTRAFEAHNDAVRALIPADQLLVFEVRQGWGPLCEFLGVPVLSTPFPRTNDRSEFWDRVSGKT
jgi:hypothetical protein